MVAQEVKALAAQTAKATDEIGSQIAGMQTATQESVVAIKEIGGTIGRISEIASTIAAAVEEQGAATQEIARNVGEAAKGTTQVANNITDVNRGAGETGSAAGQVLTSAQSLSTRKQPAQDRSRQVPQYGARRVTGASPTRLRSPVPAYGRRRAVAGRSRSGGLLGEAAHLPLHEIAIGPFVAHQHIGRPILDDLSGLQHDDAVEIPDRRKAMRDGDHGAPAHQP